MIFLGEVEVAAPASKAEPKADIARRSVGFFFEHPQGKIYDTVEYTSIIVYFIVFSCIFLYLHVFCIVQDSARGQRAPHESFHVFPHNGCIGGLGAWPACSSGAFSMLFPDRG